MRAKPARVCIVGAGLAGLACAFAVAQAGHKVEVFEAATAVSEVQAHVDVVPNMMRELACLGLAEPCVRAGFPYRRTSFLAQDGRLLFTTDAQRLAGERYPAALGISRHGLHRLLADACASAGVTFHWNVHVVGVQPKSAGAVLQLEHEDVAADLVVLACGARSKLRAAAVPSRPGQDAAAWIYLLAARPRAIDEALVATGAHGLKAHAVPIGASQLGLSLRGTGDLLSPAALRGLLRALPGPLAQLASLPYSTPVIRQVPFGMMDPISDSAAVVAVGECACALPPHFGQSAAQALEDAVVLRELLQRFEPAEVAGPFTERRAPRQREVLEITTRAARWDAAPSPDTDFKSLADSLAGLLAQPA